MNFALDDRQRADCSIEDLARIICRYMKEKIRSDKKHLFRFDAIWAFLCPEKAIGYSEYDLKIFEAIARLKQRGILMNVSNTDVVKVCFTSVGAKTDFDEELLILIDDAYEVVQAIKEKIPNLDSVVEQYYLESLRTCQNGFYISSVISLGAASERTIRCLAEAVASMPGQKEKIEKKRNIFELTRYLLDDATVLFESLDLKLRKELRERLTGLANIYRQNRNEAGHPSSVPQDWARDEQECYLSQFRRLAITCFKTIDELNGVIAKSAQG